MTDRKFIFLVLTYLLAQSAKASELPILHPDCNEFEDPLYPTQLAYPNDCTKFYKCSGGFAFPMNCPRGLHWSVKTNRCEYPSAAGCDPSIVVQPSTPSTSAKDNGNGIETADCPAGESPINPTQLAYPGDCTKFYKCEAGMAYPINCPEHLHWSTALNRCDWPDVANCAGNSGPAPAPATPAPPTPAPATPAPPTPAPPTPAPPTPAPPTPAPPTPAPPTPASTTPGSYVKCPSVDDPLNLTRLPHPGVCNRFYLCINGQALPYSCPNDLHWSSTLKSCVEPSVANCPWAPTPAPPTPASPTPGSYANCPSVDDPLNLTRLPYPGDCNRFYLCINGQALPYSCPNNLHWSSTLRSCEVPSVANCPWAPKPAPATPAPPTPAPPTPAPPTPAPATPAPPTPAPPTPAPPTPAPPTPAPATPAPPTPAPPTPAPPTPAPPTPAPTTPSPATPTSPPISPPPTSATGEIIDTDAYCRANRLGYLPYPGDCKRFVQCSNGRGYVQFCPGVLQFNSKLLTCARYCV